MRPRSILITGCSSGIGLASAKTMQARGWQVLATARRPEDLAMLEGMGLGAIPLELRDTASIAACAARALERAGGRLDAVFNNAAYGQPGAVEDLPVERLREQFEVNLFGWHDLTRRLLPPMIAAGEGRIVQCSSVLGLISPPFRGAYNASKFALEALTDAMRYELKGTGLQVSIIEPGPIRSRFVDRALVALRDGIDTAASRHAEKYRTRLEAMSRGGKQTWKLEPEAVAAKLVHALESRRPKVRYYVTTPTYLAAYGRRFLPRPIYDLMVERS